MKPEELVEEMAFARWTLNFPWMPEREDFNHPLMKSEKELYITEARTMLRGVLSRIEDIAEVEVDLCGEIKGIVISPEYRSWMEKGGSK